MILAVDAGNSRVKWALHDGRGFVREGWALHADLDALDAQWSSLPAPSAIVIANVAGDGIGQRLRKSSERWKAAPRWVSSARSQAGVSNRYDEPSQLGIDRWAALIGARRFSSDPCVVVNAGTAMTVDALTAKGEFIGGVIVPGFDLMHEALAAHTARLSAGRGDFTSFPRTTRDAITSGAIQALCGTVERMRDAMLAAGNREPVLIFSGGAGELVARHMGRPVRVVDKLVLEGLVQIALEPQ
ncbi:MAG: type III pantothenate kinase [Betaproteobacteria bacterium]|nr:type III pantothenate kinase [Betaproteobacteria bacterium]